MRNRVTPRAWPLPRRALRLFVLPLTGAFALAMLCSHPAAAFELLRADGNPCGSAKSLFWPPASAALSVDPLDGADANLLLQGADTWNASAARFRFRSGSGDHCNRDDGVIGVAFAASDCNGQALGGVLGLTVSIFRTESGQLVDGSITFNPSAAALNSQPIFLQAAMHELGHVLGLDHSDACGASGAGTLMRATIVLSEPRLDRPQADDIAGANSIYGGGSNGGGTTELSGTNSCAMAPGGASASVPLSLLAAAGAIATRRRRAVPRRIAG